MIHPEFSAILKLHIADVQIQNFTLKLLNNELTFYLHTYIWSYEIIG